MLATTLARIYAKSGLRVLLADLDPQGTSSEVLAPETRPNAEELGARLSAGQSLLPLVCSTAAERLFVVPASERLAVFETALASDPMGVIKVRNALTTLRDGDFDLVIVDTPPSFAAFTFGTLSAAVWAVIPTFCEEASIRTLPSAFATIAEAKSLNPGLRVLAVVANRLDRRTRHGLSALATLRSAFREQLADTVIPAAAAVLDCMRARQGIDADAPASSALVDLAEELLGRMTLVPATGASASAMDGLDCPAVNAVEGGKDLVAVNE